jgi:uncharacterized protein
VTEPVNAFMNARIDGVGRMVIFEPRSRAGGHVDVRAERGLLVAVSACAGVNDCIGGSSTSIGVEIRPPGPRNGYG